MMVVVKEFSSKITVVIEINNVKLVLCIS
jgi:hypothetical protein